MSCPLMLAADYMGLVFPVQARRKPKTKRETASSQNMPVKSSGIGLTLSVTTDRAIVLFTRETLRYHIVFDIYYHPDDS
jgi:hypothetical protein